ncbi:MAG: hypothetical protein QGF00_21630 [Planctomycetota bacterium]|jgi:tetratricopeptide (TPR) repeat protein|nr:hypothetical protein [Planctomycetota bacterium]MDP7252226.1 hypothetical protein [Planctomycetota bacterium]
MKHLITLTISTALMTGLFAQPAPEHNPGDKKARARRLLDELARQEVIRVKEREYMSQRLMQAGKNYMKQERWQEAIVALKKSIALSDDYEDAKNLLAQARHEAGLESGKNPSVLLRKIEAERKVAQQVTLHEMERMMSIGKKYFETSDYQEAISVLENSLVLARSIQALEGVAPRVREAKSMIDFSREALRRNEILRRHKSQEQAATILQAERQRQRRIVEGRKNMLVHRVRAAMESENYDIANNMVDELLAVDPLNATARSLKSQLARAHRSDRGQNARVKTAVNVDELLIQTDEESTPITTKYEFPANWEEIKNKRPKSRSEEEDLPQWKLDILVQLDKRVSFDFLDTPLADVVAFLQNLTGVNMVVDPGAVEGDDIPVTLKVGDMKLGAALDWILRLVNLQYAFQDEAIFISTKERIKKPETLRIYDVRDLLAIIPDYSGTGLPSIGEGGGGGGGGGGDLFADGEGGGERFTGEDLVEFIQQTIAPESWGDGEDDF